jgi:hypothetical protein
MGAPSWVGIGAQRSGTTWFTVLLTRHPDVDLATNGKKEQQLLHKVADRRVGAGEYLALFPEDGVRRGDFSPQYLRHPSCGVVVPRLMPQALILVLLRDPVERYRSAMRLSATRGRSQPYPIPINLQTWAGCYADQLDMWASFVGRDRLHVMVYEQVRADPQAYVDDVWRELGLAPVPLGDVEEPSRSSSAVDATWAWPEGTREALQVLYRPQARRLARDWGLDVRAWESLA